MWSFGNFPEAFAQYQQAKIAILPIPFDLTTSWLKGSDLGPQAIIEASRYVELYDIETNSEVYKQGICTEKSISAQSSPEMVEKAYDKVKSLLQDNKFVVTLGGEHTISLGPIKAHAEYFGDISILHLDAHADIRDTYFGDPYSHACIMGRAKDYVDNIVSVGIRSMDISERDALPREKLFLAEDIAPRFDNGWISDVVAQLGDKVYISLDVDIFEIGIMPSTGTPEPGGLGWYQVTNLLKAVCAAKDVVGIDFVELMPTDYNKAPDFLVAKLIYKFLSYRFEQ